MQSVSLGDIHDAARLLEGVIRHTPSLSAGWIEKQYGIPVSFKCENLQRAGSFKIRGAYNRIARLTEQERSRGVVAASAGNHAQGVALAAQILGIKATIFMPNGAPLPKLQATIGYGASVKFHGATIDETLLAAFEFSEQTGAIFIHPFDHEHIVAGQGTMGLEILTQNPDVKTVVVCTGGGGLLAGTALAIKSLRPDIKVIGVQAEMAAAYPPSLAAGSPQMLPRMATMADGIAVGKPGVVPFKIIQEHVDEIRTVSEASLARALLVTLERSKLQVEAGGIAAVAAILDDPDSFEGPVVASLSGGNIDPLLLNRVLRTGLATSGRFLMVQVRLRDQPGALATLVSLIGEMGTNIIQVSQSHMNPALALSEVDVELELETRGFEQREEILNRIIGAGFDVVTHY